MKRIVIIALTLCFGGVLADDDFLNIRTNPLMVFGNTFVDLEIDFKVNEHWSLGPFAQADTSQPVFDVGLRATRFEEGTFQKGWMTGIELYYSQAENDDLYYDSEIGSFCSYSVGSETCGLSAEQKVSLAVDHGYLWRWNTFNVGVGVGSLVAVSIEQFDDVAVLPSLHFSIGWVR